MKRFAGLVVLIALSSPVGARESYSFSVHGHRIHVEADRHCRSLSCVAVSIPGVGRWRHRFDRDDEVAAVESSAPAPAAAPPLPPPVPAVPVIRMPPAPMAAPLRPVEAVPIVPPPAVGFGAPAAPPPETSKASSMVASVQPQPTPEPKTADRTPPAAEAPADDSPVGDWQSAGHSGELVHIETCGAGLCGYALEPATWARGESILVNMKPKTDIKKTDTNKTDTNKTDIKWIGNVYSRGSGNTYYGTMTLKKSDTLWIEACALGRFLCSGHEWVRVGGGPDAGAGSSRAVPERRS